MCQCEHTHKASILARVQGIESTQVYLGVSRHGHGSVHVSTRGPTKTAIFCRGVANPACIRISNNTAHGQVHPFARLGGQPQDLKYAGEVSFLLVDALTRVSPSLITVNVSDVHGLHRKRGQRNRCACALVAFDACVCVPPPSRARELIISSVCLLGVTTDAWSMHPIKRLGST